MKTYAEIVADREKEQLRAATRRLLKGAQTPGDFRQNMTELGGWNVHNIDLNLLWDSKGEDFVNVVYDTIVGAQQPRSAYANLPTLSEQFESPLHRQRLSHLWAAWAKRNPDAADHHVGAIERVLHSAIGKGDAPLADFSLSHLPPHAPSQRTNHRTILGEAFLASCKAKQRLLAEGLATLAETPEEIRVGVDETFVAGAGCVTYFRRVYPNESRRASKEGSPTACFPLTQAFKDAARGNQVDLMADIFATTDLIPEMAKFAWPAAAVALKDFPRGEALQFLMANGWAPDKQDDPALRAALLLDRTEIARSLHAAGGRVSDEGQLQFQREIWRTSAGNLRLANEITDLRNGLAVGAEELFASDLDGDTSRLGVLNEIINGSDPRRLRISPQAVLRSAVGSQKHEQAEFALAHLGAKITSAEIDYLLRSVNVRQLELFVRHGLKLEALYTRDGTSGPATRILSDTAPNYRPQHVPFLRAMASLGAWLTPDEAARFQNKPGTGSVEAFVALSQFRGGDVLLESPLGPEIQRGRKNLEEWERQVGRIPPPALMLRPPNGLKTDVFDAVREWLASDAERTRGAGPNYGVRGAADAELDEGAYKLACLFGSKARVLNYVESHAPNSSSPVRDLAQFKFPVETGWDIQAWGDACLEYGPAMTKYLGYAPKLGAPGTLSETRRRAAQFAYARGQENPSLAAVCFEVGVAEQDFEAALELHREIDLEHASEAVPDLSVDGADFGMPGFRWTKAPAGDQRILVAGRFVGTCQSIGWNGEECAKHAAKSPYGSCYFLSKPSPQGEEIAGVGWMWVSARRELGLDSFDPVNRETARAFPKLVECLRERVEREHPDIAKFTIGTGGRTPKLPYPVISGKGIPHPKEFHRGPRDSRAQYLVWDRPKDISRAEENAALLAGAVTPGEPNLPNQN